MRGCNICLTSKAVRHKLYGDLQSLPVSTHYWKDLSIDFITGLAILTDWKGDSYNSILVIVHRLTKMVYYKPVMVTINALGLTEVIIDVVVRYHGLSNSIVTDQGSIFISKFWSLLCYFLGIKWRLFTAFHPQIDSQTKRQNSTMAEFAYNNVKNAGTGFMLFELNCRYHSQVFISRRPWSPLTAKNRGRTILRAPRVDDRLLAELPPRTKASKASPQ